MGFDEIAGQSFVVESLRNAVKYNMVSNGYIFSGPEGCGKKLMAFNLAMAVNCSGEVRDKPCGYCSSCVRTRSGNHPNIMTISPTGLSIKIRQIRQIISDVAKKPFESGYKVVIVEEAEKMTQEAQDAFLKILEEPPSNTVFILLVENHKLLLPTIVSRCQVHQFRPVASDEIKRFIEREYDFSSSDIELAVRHSKGVVGRALDILKDGESHKVRMTYIDILDKALTGRTSEAQLMAMSAVETKEEAERFLEFSMGWFRDIMVFREGQGLCDRFIINIDSLEKLSRHNSFLTEAQLNSIMDIIRDTSKYVKYNVGIKNSIDGMLFNIAEVCACNG